MLTILIVVNILQCVRASNLHIVRLKLHNVICELYLSKAENRGTRVAQSAQRVALDFKSGCDLMVHGHSN